MKTIVFPTDYSEAAGEAGRAAIKIAEKFQSKLIFFHSIVNFIQPDTPPEIIIEMTNSIKGKEKEKLIKYADSLIAESGAVIAKENIHYILEDSFLLTDSLVLACKEMKADLVVMGTTGASGLKRVFLGSNTANFISKATCTVLAIPEEFSGKNSNGITSLNKAAIGIDLTRAREEVKKAVDFFRYITDRIDLVHVYPNYPEKVSVKSLQYDTLLKDLKEETGFENLNLFLEKTEEPNQTAEGLQQFIGAYKPDVLAVFSVKRSFFDTLFDPSRSVDLVSETKIPIVVFPVMPN